MSKENKQQKALEEYYKAHPMGSLSARPWNIGTFHTAIKKCKGDPVLKRQIYSHVGTDVEAFRVWIKGEVARISSLDQGTRVDFYRKVDKYVKDVFECLSNGETKDDFDSAFQYLTVQRNDLLGELERFRIHPGNKLSKTKNVINLVEEQLKLLNWFNDMFPEICFIPKYPKLSPKTNYKNAKLLAGYGFIQRPKGKSRGYVITDKGKEYINTYYS